MSLCVFNNLPLTVVARFLGHTVGKTITSTCAQNAAITATKSSRTLTIMFTLSPTLFKPHRRIPISITTNPEEFPKLL